ncbi:MAG TPA: DUF4932 domain-containing protein [Phycisphaerae bacterium]|nr:DUF4932 domain-containing protein [Phycisphaerae bacterium]HRS26697.1 DUF4932 domain-containing protein [Phycisphaerae bacterium]HRT40480.1 DUF4932 domain-containing protein [Phycisphaerae bacterium]
MLALIWLIIAGNFVAFADAPPPAERQLRGAVDTRVELMSIIFRLAGNPEYNMPNSNSRYADEVEQHFGRLRNHPAVKYAQELRQKAGISYDAVMSLAVHTTDALELNEKIPFDQAPARLDARWKTAEAREFLKLARQFARDSGFRRFVRNHESYYNAVAERINEQLAQRDYLKWFDDFFGAQPQASYSVAVGLLNGGSNYGVGVRYPDGREEITPVLGVAQFDEQGLPVFDDSFGPLLIHELCHSYANPHAEKYEKLLEPAGLALYARVGEQMKKQAYSNWKTMLSESLVRACVARYQLAAEGEEAAAKLQAQDAARGFYWIGDLVELLGQYENTRQEHPKLDDFMPDVLVFFDKFAKQGEPALATKSDSTVLASRAPGDTAVKGAPSEDTAAKPAKPEPGPVAAAPADRGARAQAKSKISGGGPAPRVVSIEPANGARDVSPDLEAIVVRFDRPMMNKSFSVCGSGPHFPELAGDVSFDSSRKVLTIPVKLKPDWSYEFSLNCESYRNFKSEEGIELEPYKVAFRTAKK